MYVPLPFIGPSFSVVGVVKRLLEHLQHLLHALTSLRGGLATICICRMEDSVCNECIEPLGGYCDIRYHFCICFVSRGS